MSPSQVKRKKSPKRLNFICVRGMNIGKHHKCIVKMSGNNDIMAIWFRYKFLMFKTLILKTSL